MADDRDIRRDLVYSRRRDHKLRPRRQALMRELLPEIEIDLGPDTDLIDPRALFSAIPFPGEPQCDSATAYTCHLTYETRR